VLWLAALVVFALATGLRAPLFRVLMVAGLIAMAMSHTRNAELLATLAPLLLAPSLRTAANRFPLHPGWRAGIGANGAAVMVFVAAATAVALFGGRAHQNPAIAPASAVTAAKRAGLSGPVFNDYDFGGFLIFEGVPVFVDGRIDLYGDDFMRAYAEALDARGDALSRLLDRDHIAWTLLKPDAAAVAALDRDPAWERVYADASAVVHRQR
jgi:hypothetical protein